MNGLYHVYDVCELCDVNGVNDVSDMSDVPNVSTEGGAEVTNVAGGAAARVALEKARQQLAALGGENISSRLNVSRTVPLKNAMALKCRSRLYSMATRLDVSLAV